MFDEKENTASIDGGFCSRWHSSRLPLWLKMTMMPMTMRRQLPRRLRPVPPLPAQLLPERTTMTMTMTGRPLLPEGRCRELVVRLLLRL